MKKRIATFLLTLCLLLTTLIPGAPVLAEESAIPAPQAELMEEIPAEEEFLGEEEISAEEEVPAEEESLIEEELPAEEELPIEEELPPEEAQPAEGEAPAEEEIPESEISEDSGEIDGETIESSFDTVALGSANVQYAGVTYLSQAAFNSMDSDSQDAYVDLVDQVTGLLDHAVVLEDVVFALDADGNLHFNISMPLQEFSEALAPEDMPEAIEAPVTEEPAPEEELVPEEEPVPEESLVPEAELIPEEEAPEEFQPVEENMGLIEALDVPLETIAGSVPLEDSVAILDDVTLQEFNTLFWDNKDYFYDQLDSEAKKFYNAGYKSLVKKGKNKFTTWTNISTYHVTASLDAVSALILSYPQKFDWMRGLGTLSCGGIYNRFNGKAKLTTTLSKSKYYSASLEKQAQSKVKELVSEAYEFAKERYPSNPTYGLVYYFDDWLCANNYYDEERGVADGDPNTDPVVKAKRQTEAYFYCNTSYGCLLKGYGACESYALAMSRLLDAAGIPNLYVIGETPGGYHTWNYVQMPDGVYYLQDSAWDDPIGSLTGLTTREYLLRSDDGRTSRIPTGQLYGSSVYDEENNQNRDLLLFRFPTLSSSNYTPAPESIVLDRNSIYLGKGKSEKLSLSAGSSYYSAYQMAWASSDTKVAAVNSNGKVTAKGFGSANISLTIAGKTVSCPVYVYQFTGLGFKDNKDKSSYKMTYNGALDRSMSLNIDVLQKSYDASAQSIRSAKDLDAPKATVDKKGKSVVDNVSAALSGNTIVLSCVPRKVGNAAITVKFAGKSAKLTLQVRQPLQSNWFSLNLNKLNAEYDGKAKKPPVETTFSAPDGLKQGRDYSVSYADNVNAGTARVIIQGKGNYGGEIPPLTFTIHPTSIDSGKLMIIDAGAQTYNGTALAAKPTIKLGGKKLKAGVDYEIHYNGSTNIPTVAGRYTLTFVGTNYSGNFSDGETHEYEIKPVALSKLKISMKGSVKADGSRVSAGSLNLKLMSGKKEISNSNYDVSFQDSQHNAISAPSEPGTYFAVVKPRGSNIDTSKTETLTKKFTIKKK